MLTSPNQLHRAMRPIDALWQRRWLLAFAAPLVAMPFWFVVPPATFGGLLLFLLLACATVTDVSGRKIYNWTTYTAFAWAILLNAIASPSTPRAGSIGLTSCLAGAGICFLLMLIPYSLARGGAGDVKLAVAIGALVGVMKGCWSSRSPTSSRVSRSGAGPSGLTDR